MIINFTPLPLQTSPIYNKALMATKENKNLLRLEINTNKHIMDILGAKEYLQINGKYLVPKNYHIRKNIIIIILLDDNVNINMRIF
jgi:hypothetical protein